MFQQGYTVRPTNRFWAAFSSDLLIEQCLIRSLKSQGGITRGRSVTESARMVWISSIHRLASARNAMSNLSRQHRGTNDLTNSRVLRDKDLITLIDWINLHNPFDPQVAILRSISTGLTITEDDKINFDNIEDTMRSIQLKLDNVCIESPSIKKSDQVKTLDALELTLTTKLYRDPLILLARLTALLQREGDVTDKFDFEFCRAYNPF